MPDWLQYVAPILAAIAGLMAGKFKNRNTLIDQLQEERAQLTKRLDELDSRVTALYQDKHFSRLYIAALIEWGNSRVGPPAPEAPKGYIF